MQICIHLSAATESSEDFRQTNNASPYRNCQLRTFIVNI